MGFVPLSRTCKSSRNQFWREILAMVSICLCFWGERYILNFFGDSTWYDLKAPHAGWLDNDMRPTGIMLFFFTAYLFSILYKYPETSENVLMQATASHILSFDLDLHRVRVFLCFHISIKVKSLAAILFQLPETQLWCVLVLRGPQSSFWTMEMPLKRCP